MSLSPLVPVLLFACWVLPALLIALLRGTRAASDQEVSSRVPATTLKGIRADVRQMDVRNGTERWRSPDWGGPGEALRAQVRDSSHEVMLITPYAEASVSVSTDIGAARRRCSLCLN